MSIKHVVTKARTMMVHAALRWPEQSHKDLWPLALQHASYLHNHTPKQSSGLSPEEIWTGSKSKHHELSNLHTWGCPVYVLEPRLQDGAKIPKWVPRSRRGQFVGYSTQHASTVGLEGNLRTGNLSPQFHVVYDDSFEMVYSGEEEPPLVWHELLTFNRYQFEFDPLDTPPPLQDEWLNPQELEHKRQREKTYREQGRQKPTLSELGEQREPQIEPVVQPSQGPTLPKAKSAEPSSKPVQSPSKPAIPKSPPPDSV